MSALFVAAFSGAACAASTPAFPFSLASQNGPIGLLASLDHRAAPFIFLGDGGSLRVGVFGCRDDASPLFGAVAIDGAMKQHAKVGKAYRHRCAPFPPSPNR